MYNKQEIIIRRYRDGESISHIAREIGVCRQTVRSYVKDYSEKKKSLNKKDKSVEKELIDELVKPPQYDSSNRKKRKITDDMVSQVKKCLEENIKKRSRGQHKQQMKKIDIFEYLQEKGYQIGYTSVCKLVNKLENAHSEAFIKQKYAPGDVCEFDWGEVKLFINGKLKKIQQAVFTSAYGNYRFSVLFSKQDTQSFQEAHALFFEYIGATYRTMVYDNMKVAVKKFVGRHEKEATKGLLQLSTYYNFNFRFCNIRSGNEKGHVERSVEYVRSKAFCRNDKFSSLEDANKYLLSQCKKLNQIPQKGNKNQTAMELFQTEKEYLLPALTKFECARLSDLRVDKYSTITVDTCHYSVPEKYVGKFITAKIYSSEIICYYDNEKICAHKKTMNRQEWIINIEHYLQTLRRKPGAIINSLAFSQMKEEFQSLYRRYFDSKSRDFIELLIYMKNNDLSLKEIQAVIDKLERLCPRDISTVKIKTIIERSVTEEHYSVDTGIEKEAINQLTVLSQLLPHKNTLIERGDIL